MNFGTQARLLRLAALIDLATLKQMLEELVDTMAFFSC